MVADTRGVVLSEGDESSVVLNAGIYDGAFAIDIRRWVHRAVGMEPTRHGIRFGHGEWVNMRSTLCSEDVETFIREKLEEAAA